MWICSLAAQGWVTHWFDSKAWCPHASCPYAALVGDTILLAYDLGVRWPYQSKHGASTPRGTVCSRVGDFCGTTSQRGLIWPPFVHGTHTHEMAWMHTHAHSYTHIHSVLGTILERTALWEQNLSQFIMSSAFTFVSAVLWTASGSAKKSFLIRITQVISKPTFFLCSSLNFPLYWDQFWCRTKLLIVVASVGSLSLAFFVSLLFVFLER